MKQTIRLGIPEHAKLAFKGEIFEVWQWEQEMLDGSKEIFEKVWRPSSVSIIATMEGKIIIEDQEQPSKPSFIALPSGRADSEDDILGEAKREMLEETGCSSSDWESFFDAPSKSGGISWHEYFFIAHNCKKTSEQKLDAGERISVRLISFEDLLALADEPRFRTSAVFLIFLKDCQQDAAKREAFRKLLFK